MNRSPFSCHILWVTIPPLTEFETILALKKRMDDFRKKRRDLKLKVLLLPLFTRMGSINIRPQTISNILTAFSVLRPAFQYIYILKCICSTSERKITHSFMQPQVVEACVRDLDRNGLRILIYVEQRVSFQDNSLRYKVLDACEEEILLACKDLDIDVTSGVAVQPVQLLSNTQLNLRENMTSANDPARLFDSNASIQFDIPT